MPLETFDFDIDYPLSFSMEKKVRVREPISGARQTRTDRETRRKFEITSAEFDTTTWLAIGDFWHRHYPSTNFLFHKKDTNETFEAYFASDIKVEQRGWNDISYSIVIQEANSMPTDFVAPTAPVMNAASSITTSGFNLTWVAATDNVGVTGYELQIATSSNFTTGLETISLGNVLTYAVTGRAKNTNYHVRVRAIDAAGNAGAWSNQITIQTKASMWNTGTTYTQNIGIQTDDSLIIINGNASYRMPSVVRLNNIGDWVSQVYTAKPAQGAANNTAGQIFSIFQGEYAEPTTNNKIWSVSAYNGLYFHITNVSNSAKSIYHVDGDVMTFELGIGGAINYYKNGTLAYTFSGAEGYAPGTPMKIVFGTAYLNYTAGAVFPPLQFGGSGINWGS